MINFQLDSTKVYYPKNKGKSWNLRDAVLLVMATTSTRRARRDRVVVESRERNAAAWVLRNQELWISAGDIPSHCIQSMITSNGKKKHSIAYLINQKFSPLEEETYSKLESSSSGQLLSTLLRARFLRARKCIPVLGLAEWSSWGVWPSYWRCRLARHWPGRQRPRRPGPGPTTRGCRLCSSCWTAGCRGLRGESRQLLGLSYSNVVHCPWTWNNLLVL